MNTDRIPATIVTGFLGAGKTTLIRSLIASARGRRIAIIVNEFGDMGFDGSLIADCDDDCRPDHIVELTNGCICCTVADEFLPTIEALLARDPAPEHIVIETSGLALPQPLVRAFSWPSVRNRVTVDGVVTVVDADAVAAGRFAPDVAATRAQLAADPAVGHDDPIEELFEDQLRCADLIVLSKTDLVSPAGLAEAERIVRREMRAGTGIVRGGGTPADVLLGIAASAEGDMKGRESHHELEGGEHDHDGFVSYVFDVAPLASVDALRARVAGALAVPGVLRIKGRVAILGKSAPATVQAVGPRLETSFSPGAVPGGLVVIGLRALDRAAVAAALAG
ncbi:MAG: cobalamin biosynthesis protein CobW [Bauldia sp.]